MKFIPTFNNRFYHRFEGYVCTSRDCIRDSDYTLVGYYDRFSLNPIKDCVIEHKAFTINVRKYIRKECRIESMNYVCQGVKHQVSMTSCL